MRVPEWSITDFMTDGAFAAALADFGDLLGVELCLFDRAGRRIEHDDEPLSWRVADDPERASCVVDALASWTVGTDRVIEARERTIIVLPVEGIAAGALVIDCDDPTGFADSRPALTRAALRLSNTVSELCEQSVEIRHRNAELGLLVELSAMLVTTHEVEAVASEALASAVNILGADAGTVHLLADEGRELRLKAASGLSQPFIDVIETLPVDRVLDGEALDGSVSVVDDLIADGRSHWIKDVQRERLVSMISAGLAFQGQRMGLMRLYSRRPLEYPQRSRTLMRAVAEQIASAVAGARHLEAQRRQRRTARHLKLAADVQRRMLPRTPPSHPTLDLGARYVSSLELGGDFYDFIDFRDSLGIALGDVVGKGVPAALLMSAVRASLRAHAADTYHIDDVMARVNRDMTRDTLSNEFATIFYGVIDRQSLRLTYCNAGHEPAIVLRGAPATAVAGSTLDPSIIQRYQLREGGMVVGVDETQQYRRGVFDLAAGDVLLIFSDGATEAMDFEQRKFTRDRLLDAAEEFLLTHPEATAQSLADHLVWSVRRFIGLSGEADDITLVAVRVREATPERP